jgi:hypothetical protein
LFFLHVSNITAASDVFYYLYCFVLRCVKFFSCIPAEKICDQPNISRKFGFYAKMANPNIRRKSSLASRNFLKIRLAGLTSMEAYTKSGIDC